MTGFRPAPNRPDRGIRLDTLIALRWLAISGQAAAIAVIGLVLGFEMPVGLCFAVTALSAWLNLFLRLRFPPSLRLTDRGAVLLLSYDMVQLGALLFLTGGLWNPFALLLVVPTIVSATALPVRYTIRLGAFALTLTALLGFFHLPLPWLPGEDVALPDLFVVGVGLAILCALAFTGFYAFRVSDEARQLAAALAATELVLERERHLSALDGLAAAAAHELGTPLATITVVAKEMLRGLPEGSDLTADVKLLVSQAQRCRDILGRLTSLSTETDWTLQRQRVTHLLDEAAEPHKGFDREIRITVASKHGPEPVGRRNPAILYAVGNLMENAVDFAKSRVDVTVAWSPETVTIEVADDGPGFAPEVIDRIGDPYVTTRSELAAENEQDPGAGGLGLGFFIAKTFLERSGAELKLANRSPPATGAVVRITWPRAAYGMDDDETMEAETTAVTRVGSSEDAAL